MRDLGRIRLIVLSCTYVLGACANNGNRALFEDLLRVAQQGNPEAQYHVGMMFNNGLGVTKDPKKAFEWFEKSASSGDPLGSYKLGRYFGGQFGDVVPVDPGKSLQYKLVAADAGYDLAQYDVGLHHFKQKKANEAVQSWELAAKQGYPVALYSLSVVYREGKVVPKDNVRAFAYFKLAKLLSENKVSERAQAALEELKSDMSSSEVEKAERIVSEWKPQPTSLTIKAYSGVAEAKKLVSTK